MIKIIGVPAFQDNYIWLLVNPESRKTVVVDPGDAEPVINTLVKENLELEAILVTHHHHDHCGGVEKLLHRKQVPVYGGAKEPIPLMTVSVEDQQLFKVPALDLQFKTLHIPGHTLGHVAYVNEDYIFSGDTLFTAGCGRLFEGTADQMLTSLKKLKALNPKSLVYCGHEYTANNLNFAKTLEPYNEKLLDRLAKVKDLRKQMQPTVPASLALELETNPFLRTDQDSIRIAAEKFLHKTLDKSRDEVEIFAAIRKMKDQFTG